MTIATRAPSQTRPQWNKKTAVALAPPRSPTSHLIATTAKPRLTRAQTAREVRRSQRHKYNLYQLIPPGCTYCPPGEVRCGDEVRQLRWRMSHLWLLSLWLKLRRSLFSSPLLLIWILISFGFTSCAARGILHFTFHFQLFWWVTVATRYCKLGAADE